MIAGNTENYREVQNLRWYYMKSSLSIFTDLWADNSQLEYRNYNAHCEYKSHYNFNNSTWPGTLQTTFMVLALKKPVFPRVQ